MAHINEIDILLNNFCNLRCDYCHFREDRPEHYAELSIGQVKKTLELYFGQANISQARDGIICFNGDGEVLLSLPVLMEAIAYANQLKARAKAEQVLIAVVTNGTLVDAALAAEFARLGVVVTISLDGEAQQHDKHRIDAEGKPSHRETLRGIQLFQEAGVPVSLRAVVTPETVGAIKQSYLHLAGLNPARPVKLRPVRKQDDVFDPDWVKKYGKAFSQAVQELLDEGVPLEKLPDDAIHFGKFIREGSYRKHYCGAGVDMLWLSPKGELVACGLFSNDDEILGHIDDLESIEDLEKLLAQPHACEMAHKSPDVFDSVCLNCEWVKVCHGGCSAYTLKAETGAYTHPPLCSFYMNLGNTLKSRLAKDKT